jgi:hypothetical protein
MSMWQTLIDIAWGERSNGLNQIFSAMLGVITLSQGVRYARFHIALGRWKGVFGQAKLDFEREGSIKLTRSLDDLLPPNPAATQLWVQLPPLLLMLGLLGTFIGLTLALAQIPFSGTAREVQEGVKQALPSMGSAFWTSLSALGASMCVRAVTLLKEAAFRAQVLDYVAQADPRLVYQVEQQAFLANRPGALLRPHSLREVIWQQNKQSNEHLQELIGQLASSIRELPVALGSSGVSGASGAPGAPGVEVELVRELAGLRADVQALTAAVREQSGLSREALSQERYELSATAPALSARVAPRGASSTERG